MSVSFVNLPVSILKEGNYYIAYTPSLDLSTVGETFEEAQKRFKEIVQIFFEELKDKGTTDEVLAGLGWEKVQTKWTPPVEVSHKLESIQISQII